MCRGRGRHSPTGVDRLFLQEDRRERSTEPRYDAEPPSQHCEDLTKTCDYVGARGAGVGECCHHAPRMPGTRRSPLGPQESAGRPASRHRAHRARHDGPIAPGTRGLARTGAGRPETCRRAAYWFMGPLAGTTVAVPSTARVLRSDHARTVHGIHGNEDERAARPDDEGRVGTNTGTDTGPGTGPDAGPGGVRPHRDRR